MPTRFPVFMILTLGAVNEAFAQATAPAAPDTANAGGHGMTWLWIIIALVIIAGIVWYFMSGRSRTTTAGTTSSEPPATGRANVYDNDGRK